MFLVTGKIENLAALRELKNNKITKTRNYERKIYFKFSLRYVNERQLSYCCFHQTNIKSKF